MLKLLLLHKIILRNNNSTLLGKLILASGVFKPSMNSNRTLPFILFTNRSIYPNSYMMSTGIYVYLHPQIISLVAKKKRIKRLFL